MGNPSKAREKAKELVELFYMYAKGNGQKEKRQAAKYCALVHANEMIKAHDEYRALSDESPIDFMGTGSTESAKSEEEFYKKQWADKKKFLLSVKNEIQSL